MEQLDTYKLLVNELNPYCEAVKNIVEGRSPTRRWRFGDK